MATRRAEQLPLGLSFAPALDRADYLVAAPNAEAAGWLDRWPDWPRSAGLRALAVVAPAGGGKSHLLSAWRRATGGVEASGAAALEALLGGDGPDPPLLAIDDIDALTAAHDGLDVTLFHLHARLAERDGGLLFTASQPPAQARIGREDLASRLAAAPVARIRPPDEALLEGLIVKALADRRLAAPPGLPRYVAQRMERSYAAAQTFVAALDALAMAERRPISIPLARRLLERRT